MPVANDFTNALYSRLRNFASLVEPSGNTPPLEIAEVSNPDLLSAILNYLKLHDDAATLWLFLATLYGRYPSTADYQRFTRRLKLNSADKVATDILGGLIDWPSDFTTQPNPEIKNGLLIAVPMPDDEENSQKLPLTQQTVARWQQLNNATLVMWDNETGIFGAVRNSGNQTNPYWPTHKPIIVTGGTLVFVEPPIGGFDELDRLVCLARYSGITVCHIGQGLPDLTKTELATEAEIAQVGAYISVLKHSSRVAATSGEANGEFLGLIRALQTQGLAGPAVQLIETPALTTGSQTEKQQYANDTMEFFLND